MRFATSVLVALAVAPSPVFAWGNQGHEIIALIARARLSPSARARVDQILSGDRDVLTAPDMAARATWADAWRAAGHRETAPWHFVDIEIDHPDVAAACFNFEPTYSGSASTGPAQDCVIHKVDEFARELASDSTPPEEQLLALKYVLHFVGDIHQPLHASDHADRGGNCIPVSYGRASNLHAFWDTEVLAFLGRDPQIAAATLAARISPSQASLWSRGAPVDWARETFQVGRSVAYSLGSPPGCGASGPPVTISAEYISAAHGAAQVQLERAGVRLASVLERSLGDPR